MFDNTDVVAIPTYLLTVIGLIFVILISLSTLLFLRHRRVNVQSEHALAVKNRDISEKEETNRKLSNENLTNKVLSELLNSIFESSAHGIIAFTCVRDKNNKIIDFVFKKVNTKAAVITGKDIATLQNNTMLTVFPGNKDSGLFDNYVNVVESGHPFITVLHYNLDNLDRWFSINAVKNQDGIVVTFLDVSDMKLQEQLLITKQNELEEANRELEQFAYIASHDLKEPLRKITAFGDRLANNYSEKLDQTGQAFVSKMCQSAQRMSLLVDDLLKFSRATRGNDIVQEVDLNTVFDVVTDLLSISIKEKKATINCETLPTIKANESQMVQLFQNIISNALKYSKQSLDPVIDIKANKTKIDVNGESKEYWRIIITDNGIGFDNIYKTKIFEIFQRLHGRSDYSGSGIGLAICAKIIKNHKGFIRADGILDKGATFIFELPAFSN
ncbi:ATP-binding protein [Glaciecola sp. 1036]|uniref:sensor histidine kinase n=1 Tax=Alteromonadaceae TaxID=72275 RepID=UPI003D030E70